ncbi:hypothetical protein QCA50_000758 [Cerrena zonata]|uniref:Hydrophobin n=1 Tax=Cerrena zonata TaxID=2478898 RepID=A0AAW0H040_9APHY
MFSRVATFAILPFALLAVATPAHLEARNDAPSSCDTGPIQCCQSTATAGSKTGSALLDAIGVVVQDLNVLLGITCSPISVIGTGGNSCSANPVCCEDNSHGSLISIGCVPINIDL